MTPLALRRFLVPTLLAALAAVWWAPVPVRAQEPPQLHVNRPLIERLLGVWRLRPAPGAPKTEEGLLAVKPDGTFAWKMPTGPRTSVTRTGEWDLRGNELILVALDDDELKKTSARIETITPTYVFLDYEKQSLVFERVVAPPRPTTPAP